MCRMSWARDRTLLKHVHSSLLSHRDDRFSVRVVIVLRRQLWGKIAWRSCQLDCHSVGRKRDHTGIFKCNNMANNKCNNDAQHASKYVGMY